MMQQLLGAIDQFGARIDRVRRNNRVPIAGRDDLVESVRAYAGCYWIETNMPFQGVRRALNRLHGRPKRYRVNAPRGTRIIEQHGQENYIVYSGTEANLQKRLLQHLFNEGNERTGRLGCQINRRPFTNYDWAIYFVEIEDDVLRYAVELWWKRNVGWPVFCIK